MPDGRRHPLLRCPACGQVTKGPVCDWCDFDLATQAAAEADLSRVGLWRARLYAAFRGLLHFDLAEQGALLSNLARWIVLGSIVGVLAGFASAGFLLTLDWATNFRESHPWLLFLLPVAGLLVGLIYHRAGGRAAAGNNLIIDEIHEPQAWVPKRMAPLVFGATVVTHIFGGSAGREGTAIQMSGSLTDLFSRLVHIGGDDRRIMLITAIAAGFGSVFGVPLAGCVFGLEVQAVGRMRYDALIPALTGSVVGDLLVRGLGVKHTPVPVIAAVHLRPGMIAKILLAGLAFGLTALLFAELTHGLRRAFTGLVSWPPLRPFVGGLMIVGLTFLVGNRDYLGLSIPLITASLAGGAGIIAAAFLLKLVFTSVTLGSGFQGGEVTPLFVIGATLGAALGRNLGAPVPLFAATGFVAVFAGATNTPLACTIMGIELFGAGAAVPFAIACSVSYIFSSHRGIYSAQRIGIAKAGALGSGPDRDETATLHSLARARRTWLPARSRGTEPPHARDDDSG